MQREQEHRVLIFDWDGTLMDSVGAIVGCMLATVEELELEPIAEGVIRGAIGLGLGDTLDALVPGAGAGERALIVQCYRRLWRDGFGERVTAFPGVGEALEELSADGHLLAVATGKSRRGLERDLTATGLGRLFHTTRTGEETLPKPHPWMLLDILDELGARPAEALMIGDSTHDLQMACNAGVAAVAVAGGSHTRRELERLGPRATLGGVRELRGWLRRDAAAPL